MRRHRKTIRVVGSTIQAFGLTALICVPSALMVGCRGDRTNSPPRQFFPDLDDQLKVKAQGRSTFFNEYLDEETGEYFGRSMRQPVAHTVPWGAFVHTTSFEGVDFANRDQYLQQDDRFFTGKDASGAWLDFMPSEWATPELLAKGAENFNIYCIVCHGGLGDGKGMVGELWSYPLPSWHDPQYQHGGDKGQDGYLFSVIRNGVPNVGGSYEYKMRPYATKVSVEESWGIVLYMRALQKARQGSPEDLPESLRLELERTRPQASSPIDGQPNASTVAPGTSEVAS